jgi:nucleoside-diphosphate-sugar epimerase
MEKLALSYCDALPISIVRPCSVFGPGNQVIIDNYKMVKSKFKFNFPGTPMQFSIIDIEDIVSGIFLCATNPNAIGEIFYFATDGTISIIEMQEIMNYTTFSRKYGSLFTLTIPQSAFHIFTVILELLYQKQGKPAPFYNQSKVLAAYAPGQVVCSDKAKKILGWKPKFSIVETIAREGKWFKDNGWI